MTKLSAPTNFDNRLIEPLAKAGVYEVYGKLTADAVGGGRPSHVLPPVNAKKLRDHVDKLHHAGIRFNYLFNAAATGGLETTAAGYKKIRQLLEQVVEVPVDSITVSNPILLQIAKRFHPELEVKVSAFANVVSVLQAQQWADMGADVITASPPYLNRELKILGEMASTVDAEIQVILNNSCIQSCAFYGTHANLHSHTSQKGHWSRGYTIDYCLLNCRLARMADPSLYIRGDWIRPEDQEVYEKLGVVYFKVVNRTNPTAEIIRRVQAYAARHYDGNLLSLVEHARDHKHPEANSLGAKARMARTFVRPTLSNPLRLKEFAKLNLPLDPVVEIDNRSLDGFLEFFTSHGCVGKACSNCNYCDEVAKKAISINGDSVDVYRERYQDALDKYLDGYFFRFFS
jgi:collagenase-like PrtC family protease